MKNIKEKIDSDKLILDTLPKNNKKNISAYIDKINELTKEYEDLKKTYYNQIQKINQSILSEEKSPNINETINQIKKIENIFEELSVIETSYEKMGLDRIIYKLGKFYKEDLESVNKCIYDGIKTFQCVGIELKIDDFKYTLYTEKYMKVFLEEYKKDVYNSEKLKKIFEQIYWKCPDLIIHIKCNFNYLYLKYEQKIDKYFEKLRQKEMSELGETLEEMNNDYTEKCKQFEIEMIEDKGKIIENFKNGIFTSKDYEDDKVKSYYETMINSKELNEDNKKDLDSNIHKFVYSLSEYKNYMKNLYIVNDVKKKFQDKDNHKNEYNNVIKEIEKQESQLEKFNKNFTKRTIFGRKKINDKKADYSQLVLDIKKNYQALYDAKIYKKIIENINDNSTIYDVLKFSLCFFNYLVEVMMNENKDMQFTEIEKEINNIKDFLRNPYNTIIKNITISDNKDVALIISDRYKLLNFNINKEDINVDNADNLINILNKIIIRTIMDKQDIKLKDMIFLEESKKILQ